MRQEKQKDEVKRHLWRKLLKVVGIICGSVVLFSFLLFIFFNLPGQDVRQDVLLGITFSHTQAESLGLDWRKTYIALLDEMGIREIRIPVYWNRVEKEKGVYDWEDVDWQLAEAKKRDAHIILTVGQRVPRWPECHIPEWVSMDDTLRKERLVQFVENVIERYKSHSEIEMWQIENEAFLPFFGECPVLDVSVLDKEIATVRAIDSTRPILMSDSGELSTWISAASRGDIFGTTMYRDIYKEGIGYYRYPIGPNFFKFKEWMARLFTDQEKFFVIELQGEPWGPGWIGHMPLEEQFKTMNEVQLVDTVQYAQRVGFPRIYLWGAEWWYWLRETRDYPAVWDTAKKLFDQYGYRQTYRTSISLGSGVVSARIVSDSISQAKGLSGTEKLDENEGMLFAFSEPDKYGFWMKDMKYPIDIIWMNEKKEVFHVEACVPIESYPKVLSPDEPARYVLEVPCGWSEKNSIQEGAVGQW